MALTCPACGAQIQFKSRFSTTTICSFCQALLIREGNELRFNSKVGALAEDMSIFQVGTKGTYNKVAFEIIGQIKIDWSDGYWNEWYVIDENGTAAWIAEAMGFYSYIYESDSLRQEINPPNAYSVGDTVFLDGVDYTVTDIKNFTVEGCVGELPLNVAAGAKGIAFDLRSSGEKCAYLEYDEANRVRVFCGKNVEFEDLNLSNLRAIDGW